MSLNHIEINNNIMVFKNLLNSTGQFYFSFYDKDINLIESSCPYKASFKIFEESGCRTYLKEYIKDDHKPLILWSSVGLMWICSFEFDENQVENIYIIGPIRNVETNFENASRKLDELNVTVKDKREVLGFLKDIPEISTISLYPYTVMLNRCINSEPITRGDVRFQQRLSEGIIDKHGSRKDRSKTWQAEQMLLNKVREGDLDYKETLEKVVSIESGVRIDTGDVLERGRVSVISFLSLCIKASIEGGLSPDLAYSLGETYMKSIIYECKTVGDIRSVFRTAYEDFIVKVKKNNEDLQLSKPIQICRDYILLNKNEKISIADLAKNVGYTEYYLTRKFKEETGKSLSEYVNLVKVNEAKKHLLLTDHSIQEISDMLTFCSRSYFTKVFHNITGTTPAEFRKSTTTL